MLEIHDLSIEIGGKKIVDSVSFRVEEGDRFMIVGPNGSGKTTLLRGLMQMVPSRGTVRLNGRDVRKLSPRQLAREAGVLTQKHSLEFAHTVHEVVSLGRYSCSRKLLPGLSGADREKIEEALAITGIEGLRNRSVLSLSGGELQRVFLAQLFAQDPGLLILDEPANHLDLQYQKMLFEIIRDWSKEKGKAVMAVVHDLNLALTYGTRALMMNEGTVFSQGTCEEVLKNGNLEQVYHMDVAQWMRMLLSRWKEEDSGHE